MSAIQYPYVYQSDWKRKNPLDGVVVDVFVQFTENSGLFRCDRVDCFIRGNDSWIFGTELEAELFCEKVAKKIQTSYYNDPEQLKSDVSLYGRI